MADRFKFVGLVWYLAGHQGLFSTLDRPQACLASHNDLMSNPF